MYQIFSNDIADAFIIKSVNFYLVKDYQTIIEMINSYQRQFKRKVEVIVELKGRKIVPEVVHSEGKPLTIGNEKFIKKNSLITITNTRNYQSKDFLNDTSETEIVIKYKDFHIMFKPGDKISIDDKAILVVKRILERNHNRDFVDIENSSPMAGLNLVKKSNSLTLIDNNEDTKDFKIDIGGIRCSLPAIETFKKEDMLEGGYAFALSNKREKIRKTLSLFREKKFKIICESDNDFKLREHSYLMPLDINYDEYEIDVLSKRDIGEISCLKKLNAKSILVSLCKEQDFLSLKEVLGEKPKIKIFVNVDHNNINKVRYIS